MAYALAESLVDTPGNINPVFFYGPSGVGKTHLMQGIGNKLMERNPNYKILYVPIEKFMNQMIDAIRTQKNKEFRKSMRTLDLLLIDDIQFISNKEATKEELFNTFNTLYQMNKQIIIASDRSPKEIQNLSDRLRTRFEGGMVVDIQAPDIETRIAILRDRSQNSKIEIPNEIITFVAENLDSNVRELEGAMTKIITTAKITKTIPTIDEIAKMLQVDLATKRKRINPQKIIQAVSEVFDVKVGEIKGKRRTAYIAQARQVSMYLMREELELPLQKIAHAVNRKDHTTAIHAFTKIEELSVNDDTINNKISQCKEYLYP